VNGNDVPIYGASAMKNNNEETKGNKKEHATRYSQIDYKYFTTTEINIRQG
jgi:hypothetical protein